MCVSGEGTEAHTHPETVRWARTMVKSAGSAVRSLGFTSCSACMNLVTLGKLSNSCSSSVK